MNRPTPAIVTQSAARRLPRAALLLFCIAYVVPGFVGREPWKSQDMASLGYMYELALGRTEWLNPTLLGQPPEFESLLPYWLGAWAMQIFGGLLPADFSARLPFIALLTLTLAATWYAVYSLARSPAAQPVPFAFGGEALPTDYARAVADGGLLALIACLGLAQLSHETTPSLAQLGFTALTFYGFAGMPYRRVLAGASLAVGLPALALSGAPAMAVLFALGGGTILLLNPPEQVESRAHRRRWIMFILVLTVMVAGLAWQVDAWRWRIDVDFASGRDGRTTARLFAWFTWPAWPLAFWTLWRWRQRLFARHVALPLWFALVSLMTTLATPTADRALLLGLPALATMAAFALPTFKRSAAALIDWFTLLFFTGCAFIIWVVWISMHTGVPAKPAANVAKLLAGFVPSFSVLEFVVAFAATLAWGWLVKWRAGRHRDAIWKSMVLPAGGAALCWLLLTTLWLPVVDYARSYTPVVRGLQNLMQPSGGCVEVFGLDRGQLASLRFHGSLELQPALARPSCPWLVVAQDARPALPIVLDAPKWELVGTVRRPRDANDNLHLYRRRS